MPGFTNKAKDALPFDTPDTNDNDGKSIDMMLPAHMLRRLEMEQMREAFPAIHIEAVARRERATSAPFIRP